MIKKHLYYVAIVATVLSPISVHSTSLPTDLSNGSISVELGGYTTTYNKNSTINLIGLAGDKFQTKKHASENLILARIFHKEVAHF